MAPRQLQPQPKGPQEHHEWQWSGCHSPGCSYPAQPGSLAAPTAPSPAPVSPHFLSPRFPTLACGPLYRHSSGPPLARPPYPLPPLPCALAPPPLGAFQALLPPLPKEAHRLCPTAPHFPLLALSWGRGPWGRVCISEGPQGAERGLPPGCPPQCPALSSWQ